MTIRKTLRNIVLTGVLALSVAGCGKTEIKKVCDLTGDGIQDVLMYEGDFSSKRRGNYLFIGQKDGSYISAKEQKDGNIEHFKSDDGEIYFFNGKLYEKMSSEQKKILKLFYDFD